MEAVSTFLLIHDSKLIKQYVQQAQRRTLQNKPIDFSFKKHRRARLVIWVQRAQTRGHTSTTELIVILHVNDRPGSICIHASLS